MYRNILFNLESYSEEIQEIFSRVFETKHDFKGVHLVIRKIIRVCSSVAWNLNPSLRSSSFFKAVKSVCLIRNFKIWNSSYPQLSGMLDFLRFWNIWKAYRKKARLCFNILVHSCVHYLYVLSAYSFVLWLYLKLFMACNLIGNLWGHFIRWYLYRWFLYYSLIE